MTSTFQTLERLDGKVVVITGGTGAIGLACAQRLADLGAHCVLLYHRESAQAAQAKADALKGTGHVALQCQVTDSASLQHVADAVAQRHAKVDILINSAGFTKPVPAHDLNALSDDLIDDILRVNFRGVIASIRAFLPLLQASGDGLVVNISSIAAFTGTGSNLAYVAAKAGTDVVGDALAKAFAPTVRVVSVSPGVVNTSFVPGRGADFNEKAAATIPLKRVGTADDVAAAVQACATTLRYMTGNRIVIDGGRHL
ncbi:MAG: hypothetical protein RLZZ24_1064 [Pseudomonadota bacterium]